MKICAQLGVMSVASTASDIGPADARRRAARQWGTGQLAQQWQGSGADPQWNMLHAQHARITASAASVQDDVPPVRDDQASAAATITPTATLPNGRTQPMTSFTLYCSLVSTPAGWRVAAVSVAD